MTDAAATPAQVRRRYAELIDVLNRAGETSAAVEAAEMAVRLGLWAHPLQRPVDFVAGLEPRAVHDPGRFWFVAHLESRYPVIRAEVDEYLRSRAASGTAVLAAVDEPLLDSGRWEQVVLYEAGRRQEQACAMFPATAAAVAEIPEATTMGPGVVTLSLMQPGSRVRPHCGRTNAQLRVHLGLRVPGGAEMRVGTERVEWEEGRCVVFDDSFEHEVRHDGNAERLVLLLDVVHPDLPAPARQRLLSRRTSVEHQVGAYLAEHDLAAVELDERGIVLRPAEGSSALIRRYMTETGATAVRREGEAVRFVRRTDLDRPESGATAMEQVVAAVWTAVLRRDQIDTDADFLDLGGNSLHAVRIASQLADDLDLDLSVRSVLGCRTIRAMAAHIAEMVAEQEDER